GVHVTIALPFRRGGAHMAECADTRKKLLSLCAKLSTQFEEAYMDESAPAALTFTKENLWDFAASDRFEEATEGVLEVVECADKNEEVQLCLKEIFRAVADGHAYSDIAVIARNAESYTGILDRTLARCGIPFFFSKKTSAELLPLTRFILSALSLYIYNFKESDVAAYIKTGLCGLTDDECDLFEEYIDRWSICGRQRYLDGEAFTMSGKGYTAEVTDKDTLAAINEIKQKLAPPLARLCDSLDGAKTVREFATAIYTYLEELSIRERSVDPDYTKFFGTDKTADAIRLWNVTMEALDTLVDAAGDEILTAADFGALVRLLFSAIDIAEIPTSMDQVIIGNADTIRIDERAVVILLGAVEGVFPAPVSESPTLGEHERRELAHIGITLSQDLRLRSAREFYHFVRAIDFATKRVTLSYYTADTDGRKCEPSFAITRLRRLFPALCQYAYAALPPMDKLFYSASAADAIGRYGADTEAILCEVLTPLGMYTPPLTDASALGNAYASLSPEIAMALYGENMRLSQSKIDCYSDCHLRHFMQYILALEDTAPFEFNPANTGTFVHSVLENFICLSKESGRRIADYTEEEIEQLAASLCAAETEKILRSGGGNARMLCFFERMRRA
ncbi:MAG: PD-(D/E)XK nuclease family protein, partial [Clostridia bacterium]|nr:PD-(D/E)XK nuclease family protein [Clostridia bacterium]